MITERENDCFLPTHSSPIQFTTIIYFPSFNLNKIVSLEQDVKNQ